MRLQLPSSVPRQRSWMLLPSLMELQPQARLHSKTKIAPACASSALFMTSSYDLSFGVFTGDQDETSPCNLAAAHHLCCDRRSRRGLSRATVRHLRRKRFSVQVGREAA